MLEIRQAKSEDVDKIFDLILGIAKFHNQEQYVLTSKEKILEAGFGNEPKFEVLLAEFDGEIAGYLSYTWNYSIWNAMDYMNIDDLFVLEHFRGKKIGEEIMRMAKKVCLAKNINLIRWEVEISNAKAISFYQKLGANMTAKGIFKWNL